MNYSIGDFWRTRLSAVVPSSQGSVSLPGWQGTCAAGKSYVEAGLKLRDGSGTLDQGVWLVAAPGAVGKSTLAHEICAATGAIYVDLASSATVAGNYMVGGLVNAGLWNDWQAGRTTILVDALDEARLRVTQSSFEDFLLDVASVAKNRALPLVLLGRVGIIKEAWTILSERCQLTCPIFDIELFDDAQAEAFVISTLRKLATEAEQYPHLAAALRSHLGVYEGATHDLVDGLRGATIQDGQRFVGYAPVLVAIAKVIATESNPAKIGDAMRSVLQGRVLERVTAEIMARESVKLVEQLHASVPGLVAAGLYGAEEQLGRLASQLLGTGKPNPPVTLPQHAVGNYEQAVASLLPQHPFLDGLSTSPSGAVFGACVIAHALNGADAGLVAAAERYARTGPHAPNPFLLDFYRDIVGSKAVIPAAHVGLLYDSVQAKAEAGDIAQLTVEGGEDDQSVEIEISVVRPDGPEINYEFHALTSGALKFGRRIGGIYVDAEGIDVEIGEGGQLEMVSPISIRARNLLLNCSELVVKPNGASSPIDNTVVLEADEAMVDPTLVPPVVRPGTTLQVSWPGARAYPWNRFAFEGTAEDDPAIGDALRALRRLVISFRSHSKGRLARYKGKVEHARMTKGAIGDALREGLMRDKVLSLEGSMYFLEPNVLGQKAGVSFADIKLKRYGEQTKAYVRAFLPPHQ